MRKLMHGWILKGAELEMSMCCHINCTAIEVVLHGTWTWTWTSSCMPLSNYHNDFRKTAQNWDINMQHLLHDHAPSHRVNCKFKSTLCISNVYPLVQITTSCNYDAEQTQLPKSLCGRMTCSLGQTAISPCLIFRQFSLLPSCVASTKVLLCCSFNALNTKV